MAFVAQSYNLRDLIDPTCEWADRAFALATANDLTDVRLAALVEKGSVMVIETGSAAEGGALLHATAEEAEAVGEHVLAARPLDGPRVAGTPLRPRRRSPAAARAHATPRRDGRLRLARRARRASRCSPPWPPPTATSRRRSRCWTREPASTRATPCRATAAGSPSCERGWRWRWATSTPPRPSRRRPGRPPPAAWWGSSASTPTWPPGGAISTGRASPWRELADAAAVEGFTSPSQMHDIAAAALRAGLPAAELRPLVDEVGIFIGNRLGPDHPWRHLLEAQLAEADGQVAEAARLYAAAAESTEAATGVLIRHRGTAHVGAARALIAEGSLDAARCPRRRRRPAPRAMGRLAGRGARGGAAAAGHRTRAERPRRAHATRARGGRPPRRGPHQRRPRRAAVHLAPHGGRARVEHPQQARAWPRARRWPPGRCGRDSPRRSATSAPNLPPAGDTGGS